jgi:hypothetical protein
MLDIGASGLVQTAFWEIESLPSPSSESFDAAWKNKVRRFRANYWNLAGFTFRISANLEAIFFVGWLGPL